MKANGETIREWVVTPEQDGQRLDRALTAVLPDLTRSRIQQLAEEGRISFQGRPVKKNQRLKAGQRLTISLPPVQPLNLQPEPIELDILYEDAHLLVINKPKGMVVHPAAGHDSGTLVHALLYHCGDSLSGINGVARPGIVHRIDKDTSGLLLVAKTDAAHLGLAEQIKRHAVERVYHGILLGNLKEDAGDVDRPIGRHPVDRKKMAVTEQNSKPAVTHYRVLERFSGYTYARFQLETGRTHQIRVHAASLGHPLLGDTVYGPAKQPKWDLQGQCLHAKEICFTHPILGEIMQFSCPLPAYFEKILRILREREA